MRAAFRHRLAICVVIAAAILCSSTARAAGVAADGTPPAVTAYFADHLMSGSTSPSRMTAMEAAPPSGHEGEGRAQGSPLNRAATLILGAVAGLTIFFGLPFAALKRVPPKGLAFLNAAAVGILLFLLIDIFSKAYEPINAAMQAAQSGHGAGMLWQLLATFAAGLGIGLVGLVYFSQAMFTKAQSGASLSPMALATVIAVGIGLHNFSEGLAIGQSAATGAVQLALLLIIGFGLHNMTEGFGIAAPLAGTGGTNLGAIVRLGLIGGGPTFIGTVIGYQFVSDLLSVLFLTLAAGAIIYVVGEMLNVGRRIGFREFATIGIFVGFLLGFGTDLILTATGA